MGEKHPILAVELKAQSSAKAKLLQLLSAPLPECYQSNPHAESAAKATTCIPYVQVSTMQLSNIDGVQSATRRALGHSRFGLKLRVALAPNQRDRISHRRDRREMAEERISAVAARERGEVAQQATPPVRVLLLRRLPHRPRARRRPGHRDGAPRGLRVRLHPSATPPRRRRAEPTLADRVRDGNGDRSLAPQRMHAPRHQDSKRDARQGAARQGVRLRAGRRERVAPRAGEIASLTGEIASLAGEIASLGIAYLHRNKCMHRDIKTANVMLDKARHAKVCDFGLAVPVETAPLPSAADADAASGCAAGERWGERWHTAAIGTLRYMAPEMLVRPTTNGTDATPLVQSLRSLYDESCDVYSFGLLLWEVMHRQVPFAGKSGIYVAFSLAPSEQRPAVSLPAGFEGLEPLIRSCWHHDPSRRPSMAACVEVLTVCAKSSIPHAEDVEEGAAD
eukprot:CAMPEP_0119401938 /NCGR_PEP_ID=MMETSP1334-20130426/142626_1 /TAXON_ID=127549 /ORGANISM="Calcidiscus leptoporus, Strain RCC1130" /LENGTH=450 /DNA_ID=CAMNT_0007425863 /DNA_START=64 /DNA_END=1418 /DNA_ORIENTATION=+